MEKMLAGKSTSISLRDIDDAYVEAKAYYGNLLAGMDKDMLPLDDVEGKAEGKAQFFWSSDVDVQAVKEFCAQHDFTEKAFFNACFAYVLTKFTGRDEAFYATIHDGRNTAGSAQTATLPEKTFPVLLTVEDKESIVAFIGRMGQQLSASMAHAGFSFVDIAHEYDLTAELVFAYQGEVPAEENSGEKRIPPPCLRLILRRVCVLKCISGTEKLCLAVHIAVTAMMDTYPALACGAAVYIVNEEMRFDLAGMNACFEKHRVTHAFMTTQVAWQFAHEMENSSLKCLTAGGEKLIKIEPPRKYAFYNAYGPTENTIFTTIYKVEEVENNIPIGKPLDNVRLYIVDRNGKRLPPGACGELWVAGPQVGGGYLNRPEKTAEVFIRSPFGAGADYGRVYRTGDMVRYRRDGNVEFVGRKDGQVKVGGFRIELSEVEVVLREFPGVKDAAAAAFDHLGGGKFIAAYVVGDKELDTKAIGEFIGERKPPYMVPEAFVQLDKIPLNQNGKVNRRALPVPELMGAEMEADSHPANILEEKLRQLVGEIIGHDDVPVGLPLELSGVTSIGFIRLSALIYKQYGISIPAKKFKGISLLGVENELLRAWMDPQKSAMASAVPRSEAWTSYPLSAAQMGVYMECMKNPESTVYNLPFTLEFSRDTDEKDLAAALQRVLAAHPSLQIHFDVVGHEVMAVKNEQQDFPIVYQELTEGEYQEMMLHSPVAFRLDRPPLYVLKLLRTERALYLYMDCHHLIFDGFSVNLFLQDLAAELKGKSCAAERVSYADFALQQREFLAGEEAKEFDAYFGELFADYESPSRLTPDLPKSELPGRAARVQTEISQELVDRAVQRTGVSEAAFFLAALYYVTARLTNSDQVYISTFSSGRSDARFADTYGMFVNTLPLASKLGGGSVDEYIKDTAAGLAAALAHEEYPFAQVADKWDYSVELMYAYQRGLISRQGQGEGWEMPGLLSVREEKLPEPQFPWMCRSLMAKMAPCLKSCMMIPSIPLSS